MTDIDEYTDDELNAELNKRAERREYGLCDYCGRPGNSPYCKFPERHRKDDFPFALVLNRDPSKPPPRVRMEPNVPEFFQLGE